MVRDELRCGESVLSVANDVNGVVGVLSHYVPDPALLEHRLDCLRLFLGGANDSVVNEE